MRMNPLDQQFDPVFMGGQDRRPRQRFTGGNQPPAFAGNFGMGGPAQRLPLPYAQTGGVMPPMQRPQQQFNPFMGGNAQQDMGRRAMMGGSAQANPWAQSVGWPRGAFGNFSRFGYR